MIFYHQWYLAWVARIRVYALRLCEKISLLRIIKPASRVYDNGAQRRARLTKMPENTTCKHSAQQTTDSLSVLSSRCNGRVNHPKTARFEGGSSSGVLTQKTNESNIYVCWESNGRKVGAFTALRDLLWCRPSWVGCRSIEGRLWVGLLWCPLRSRRRPLRVVTLTLRYSSFPLRAGQIPGWSCQ